MSAPPASLSLSAASSIEAMRCSVSTPRPVSLNTSYGPPGNAVQRLIGHVVEIDEIGFHSRSDLAVEIHRMRPAQSCGADRTFRTHAGQVGSVTSASRHNIFMA